MAYASKKTLTRTLEKKKRKRAKKLPGNKRRGDNRRTLVDHNGRSVGTKHRSRS